LDIPENSVLKMVPTCDWIQNGTPVFQHSDRKQNLLCCLEVEQDKILKLIILVRIHDAKQLFSD
jgi:hypothetical protein